MKFNVVVFGNNFDEGSVSEYGSDVEDDSELIKLVVGETEAFCGFSIVKSKLSLHYIGLFLAFSIFFSRIFLLSLPLLFWYDDFFCLPYQIWNKTK